MADEVRIADVNGKKVQWDPAQMRRIDPGERASLEALARQAELGGDDLACLRALVERHAGVAATLRLVDEYLDRARGRLVRLPDTPASHALGRLVDFVRERDR